MSLNITRPTRLQKAGLEYVGIICRRSRLRPSTKAADPSPIYQPTYVYGVWPVPPDRCCHKGSGNGIMASDSPLLAGHRWRSRYCRTRRTCGARHRKEGGTEPSLLAGGGTSVDHSMSGHLSVCSSRILRRRTAPYPRIIDWRWFGERPSFNTTT